MKREEPYEIRCEMAKMHDTFLNKLDSAMKKKRFVEASWLCYAIFEQRITRIIKKHIVKCPRGKRGKDEKPIGITTRLLCLQKLCKQKYGPYADFDCELLREINTWCKRRNALIHGLVSLEHYKKYDNEFESLSKDGEPLVKRLYAEATKARGWYRADNHLEKFPEIKCRCDHRCVYEEDK